MNARELYASGLARELYRLYGCRNPKLADERWEQLPSLTKELYMQDANKLMTWMRENDFRP